MNARKFAAIAALALGIAFIATSAFSQTQEPATSGPAVNGSPAWSFEQSFPDPEGAAEVAPGGKVTVFPKTGLPTEYLSDVLIAQGGKVAAFPGGPHPGNAAQTGPCADNIAQVCSGESGYGVQKCLMANVDKLTGECKTQVSQVLAAIRDIPLCSHSPICDNRMTNGVGPIGGQQTGGQHIQRVLWKTTMGYTFSYPYDTPQGIGGIPSVAMDSKGDLWAFKRSPIGTAQLYEYGPDHKLMRTVGEDVLPHAFWAHGMAIDSHDNVWLCYATRSIIEVVSSDGKLIKTIGTIDHRGDWIEEKGQRLLWEPMMVAFAPDGDVYIAEGHAGESPNDTDSPDPTNVSGVARVIHLDKDGNYINQWYGNTTGPGKFFQVHGIAIDPHNGDVWIGDREQYRIVIYTANGLFVRTMQMRNLVCALNFDREGNPWMASGQDGQFLKLTRDGKVVGAIGNGMGIGPGQVIEASYWVFDKQGNLYAGDTSVGRITEMVAPKRPTE